MVAEAGALIPAVIGVAALLVGSTFIYNRLVRHNNLVKEAWSGVDVQLKRRHDLIPNLVNVVKGYAGFERTILEDVTRLRSKARETDDTQDIQASENALTGRLQTLLALAEGYPDLKANRSFLELQNQLAEIEEQIQMARRYHNGTVRDYNVLVESFPSNLVARSFGFSPAHFFRVETVTERMAPRLEMVK